jgi:hypothetical protein
VSKHKAQPVAISRSGTPITDEVIERLSGEAETGYDLTQGRRVGRKSLAGGSGKSPRLGFRTTPELYELAAAKAELEGKTISELAREALEQLVTK